MASQEILLTGGCMCGNIKYSCTTLPKHLTNCYCVTCRRLSGAPFLTFGEFGLSSLTWTTGSSTLKYTSYSDEAIRSHCSECGTPVSMEYKCDPGFVSITAGTFDEASVKGVMPKVGNHIFVGDGTGKGGEKIGGWYELPKDAVPRYPRHTDKFQKMLDTWRSNEAKSA